MKRKTCGNLKVVALNYDVSGAAVAITVFFFLYQQAVFRVGGGFEVALSGAPVKGGHLYTSPPMVIGLYVRGVWSALFYLSMLIQDRD
jgi:hypothetical protein